MRDYNKEYTDKQVATFYYLQKLYKEALEKIVDGLPLSKLSREEQFAFKNYPELDKTIGKQISELSKEVILYINASTREVWDLSNLKNNSIIDQEFAKRNLKPPTGLKTTNIDKYKEFTERKVKGLKLSDRVWKYNDRIKYDIQESINAALEPGKSANALAKDLMKYLNNPDARFRRIRDKNGDLKLSSAAKNYHPGRGVYRSAFANALRLARTEINNAHHEADYERWKETPFIIGYRVNNSKNRVSTVCPICKSYDGVLFPKRLRVLPVHPQCMCNTTSVFCSDEDFERIAKGENVNPKQPPIPAVYNAL